MTDLTGRKPILCLDSHELAWAAGFFDGEGTVLSRKRSKWRELSLSVPQSETSTLRRFHAAVGGIGKLRGPYTTKIKGRDFLPRYILHAYGLEDVQAILAMLWKWLSDPKKLDAKLAMADCMPFELARVQRKANPLCKRGHPLTGPNADVHMQKIRRGYTVRACRCCQRIRAKRRRNNG